MFIADSSRMPRTPPGAASSLTQPATAATPGVAEAVESIRYAAWRATSAGVKIVSLR
jgi:hypothetical protein